ncbi:hypothetical protein EDF60_0024 [Leucobacter luti]|nr:hypothetical protein [Leucobacter luti]MCW2289173.1 hypothetical protein [Leucobacter luti]TCK46451.1 hypothetical protein EDF60_0024 [Leucobacter luti]
MTAMIGSAQPWGTRLADASLLRDDIAGNKTMLATYEIRFSFWIVITEL